MPDVGGRDVGDFAFELLADFFKGAERRRGFEGDGVVLGGAECQRAVAAGGYYPSPFAQRAVDGFAEVCTLVVPVDSGEPGVDEQAAAGGGEGIEDASDPEAAIDDGVVDEDLALRVVVGWYVLDDALGVADAYGQAAIGDDQLGDGGSSDGIVILPAEILVSFGDLFEPLAVDGLGDVGPEHEVGEGGGTDAESGGGGQDKNSGQAWSGHISAVPGIGTAGSDA